MIPGTSPERGATPRPLPDRAPDRTPVPGPRAPSRTNRFRRGAALLRAETLSTARDYAGLLVPVVLPLVILVANAVQPAMREPIDAGGMTPMEAYLVPVVVTMAASVVAVVNMPSFIATYRRTGILRTLSVTPISPPAVLAANVVVSIVQLLIGVGVTLAVASLLFGLRAPADPGSLALGFAAGLVGMYGLGALVAALSPTPNASVAIGLVAFLGVGALGGMFGPTAAYPEWLRTIGEVLPFGAMVDVLRHAWVGLPLDAMPLLGLGTCGIVGMALGLWIIARR